jgi:hypothetical protein
MIGPGIGTRSRGLIWLRARVRLFSQGPGRGRVGKGGGGPVDSPAELLTQLIFGQIL